MQSQRIAVAHVLTTIMSCVLPVAPSASGRNLSCGLTRVPTAFVYLLDPAPRLTRRKGIIEEEETLRH